MTQFHTNIQNRKLKKQVLNFFSKLGFGAGRLPLSGKIILIMVGFLLISLFLPWIEIQSQTQGANTHGAFSRYLGFIGFGIIASICIVPFFLLSHTKKERVRSYVPFRLSDTQAVVFISAMILVAIIELLFILPAFTTFGRVEIRSGLQLAGASVVMMIISGFFLSKNIKNENLSSYYLDHNLEADF